MTDQIIMFISQLFNGLKIGSVYALVALGYTMVYGIAKMLNFAHGDVIMVGALCLVLRHVVSRPPGLGICSSLLCGLHGSRCSH